MVLKAEGIVKVVSIVTQQKGGIMYRVSVTIGSVMGGKLSLGGVGDYPSKEEAVMERTKIIKEGCLLLEDNGAEIYYPPPTFHSYTSFFHPFTLPSAFFYTITAIAIVTLRPF